MSDLYGALFHDLLYPVWENHVRRRPTLAHLRRLERTQWASPDELEALQAAELRKLIGHAFQNVPYYRERFSALGLSPDDLKELDDLRKFPLLTRDEAALSCETRKSNAPPLPAIAKMTSGSTGNPLRFGYDLGSEYWRQAVKLRGYGWAGCQPGDRTLHFWGSIGALHQLPLAKRAKAAADHAIRRELFLDCSQHSDSALAHVVDTIRSDKPSVIVCYSQSGAALARYVIEQKCRDWPSISVICGAERLFPADREALVQAFGPNIFETYGSREVMLIGAECEAHDGLHVSMENLVVELIVRDEHGERPARPGELGEVVITDLHNYGIPFIRYLNGDLAIAMSEKRCACGRGLARLGSVEGRSNDTLRDGQGRPIGGMFFIVLFSVLAHKVRAFQVTQHRDRSIDMKLVPAHEFDDAVVRVVQENCAKFLPGAPLNLQIVPEIAAGPGGKRRFVVVET